jgi:hypothetical protein
VNKTIYVKPPIIVRKLAKQIGIKPFQLIYDLANMNVFVGTPDHRAKGGEGFL